MKLHNRFPALVGKQEVNVLLVVLEEILRKHCGTSGMLQYVETSLDARISVLIVCAHLLTW